MLFHISFQIDLAHRDAAEARFLEAGAPPPPGVTMIGRWHNIASRTGLLIAESDDPQAIAQWLYQWTDLLTFEISPVLNDEQFAQLVS